MKSFTHKNIRVEFESTGGIESCYILPDFKVAFDTGKCPDALIDIPVVFLSHGHLDHASGISYYFSQRSLRKLNPGTIYVPKSVQKPLSKITRLWQDIEEFDYKCDVAGIEVGDKIEIKKDLHVMSVRANHRVSAFGYVILKTTKKLKKQYLHLSGRQIARLKEHEDIFEIVEIPIFAYSGDSTIEIIRENELMRNAAVLFMECTYIDEKRNVERARKWGHTHLDEIISEANLFKNEKVVLVHLSRRYSPRYMQSVLNRRLTEEQKKRFVYVD
ncbi:MAG: MBL fold metallo-hydrolase [Spirochaetia bacterium]|nr:MBL fold metallo-hydrolase [Spirochaetia bacterium]